MHNTLESTHALLPLCIVLYFSLTQTACPAAASENELQANWRRNDRDAINAACYLLKFHGLPVTYEQVVEEFGDEKRVSFNELREDLHDLGLSCSILKFTPDQLAAAKEPVLVFTEAGGLDHGRFGLVINAVNLDQQDGSVLLLDGGLMTLKGEKAEEFLRTWSGYGLITTQPPQTGMKLGSALLGFSGFWGLYFSWRKARRWYGLLASNSGQMPKSATSTETYSTPTV